MKNKALVVAGINFRNIKLAYLFTAIIVGAIVIENVVYIILKAFDIFPNGPDNATVSLGNYLFLLVIMSAVFIPSRNFRKMMNLGGKRAGFITGCAVNYAIITSITSLVSTVLYYTYDKYMVSELYGGGTLDVLYWFGWSGNGAVVAFFQQFAFLLLLAIVIHTLIAAQEKWYGWCADVIIVAIISIFTPILPLRSALLWFFNLIIFQSNAFLQIASCLILAAAVYSLNVPLFARKAI